MPNERDRVTVGVTPDGAENLAALMETGWFQDEMDAYRLAISTALSEALDAPSISGAQTKFNVGTLDRDGRLRQLVTLLHDSPRPYEDSERLAHAGLQLLRRRIVDDQMTLAEALGTADIGGDADAPPR
jgi:hypothetical protein